MFLRKIDKANQYLICFLFIVIVTAICFSLSAYIPYRIVALILLLCVSLVAMVFDFPPVIIAAITSALFWDYFFIPPRFTLSIGTAEDTLMLIMYFVIAFVSAALTYRIRQIEKKALLEEGRANTITLYNTILNSLSHELRTPISTIIGATDNMQLNPDKLTPEIRSELLNEISKASLRLNYQVENLLSMSRLESGVIKLNKDWCDVNDLIHSAVNKLETELKNHKVIIQVPEKFPLCKVDFGLIERALYNLLLNASIYTPPNTKVSIVVDEAESIVKEHNTIDVLVHELVISISDEGGGFPTNEVRRVFDKFYRLNNSRSGGTGLGLSIVKGFIEAHEGRIKLENLSKGGAKFTMHVPVEMSDITTFKNE